MHKEELIKFWNSSDSGFRNFLKHSSTLRDRAFFHNLAYISGESDRIFMKISQMYPWTRKSSLNFGSNPDPESVSGYGLRIQTIFSLADVLWSLTALVDLREFGSVTRECFVTRRTLHVIWILSFKIFTYTVGVMTLRIGKLSRQFVLLRIRQWHLWVSARTRGYATLVQSASAFTPAVVTLSPSHPPRSIYYMPGTEVRECVSAVDGNSVTLTTSAR